MNHAIVTPAEWIAARQALQAREKELTRLRDEVTRLRMQMPWCKVEQTYEFEGADGKMSLADLFGTKSQLIIYHFMYGPDWDEGCKSCSFWADQYDAINVHIGARDVALAVISRAPWQQFEAFRARMGWRFRWLSSSGNTFNQDFKVSFPGAETGFYNFRETRVMDEMPGLSVFCKDRQGSIFHTYGTFSRGLDCLNATYQMLDLVPKGRDEGGLSFPMAWVKHHDKYSAD